MSSAWAFNLRTSRHGYDDSDSDSDSADGPAVDHEDTRLLNDLDISTREETVVYKPNPFSIAKINAAARNVRDSPTKKKPVKKVVDAAKGQPNGIAQAFQRQAQKATKKSSNLNNPLPKTALSIPNPAPPVPTPAPSISNSAPALTVAPKSISNVATQPPAPMRQHGHPTWPHVSFSSPAPRSTDTHSPMTHTRSSPLQRTSLAPKNLPTHHAASELNNANSISWPRRNVPSQIYPGPSTSQRIHSTPLTAPPPTSQHSPTIHAISGMCFPSSSCPAVLNMSSAVPFRMELTQHNAPLPRSPQFLEGSPRPAWMDASSSPMRSISPFLPSPFQKPAYLTSTPRKSAPVKGTLNAGRLHPLRKTAPVSHELSASQCKPISAPKKRPALVSAYGTPDDDERWTTLPSKKPKFLPSVDRHATFKLPGLGAPGQKSGISASSSSRVIRFLPPPLDTSKNSSLERISQYQPVSPTHSADVPKVIMYSPAKESPLRTPYRPLSPPTSDAPPQVMPERVPEGVEDVVHVDLDRIGSRYRPTREWIRQRRKPLRFLLPGLDSCGKVWNEEEKTNEIGIPLWRGRTEEHYELDPLHPDRIAAIQDTTL